MKLLTFPAQEEPGYRNIPATLRRIADAIEAGELSEVTEVVVVAFNKQLNIFNAGHPSDGGSVHLLLAAAQRKMEHAILKETGGYDF